MKRDKPNQKPSERARKRARPEAHAETITIDDVAALAEVSTATVSRTLSTPGLVAERTRKRVLDAVRKTGYIPNVAARSLRAARSKLVLVVIPSKITPFFSELLIGIDNALSADGYGLIAGVLQDRAEREAQLVHLVAAKQVDGVILLNGQMIGSDNWRIDQLEVPIVAVGVPASRSIPAVTVDDPGAAASVARHLLSLGHRTFGYVSGPEGKYIEKERWQGFSGTLAEEGIAPESVVRLSGDFGGPSGVRAAELFLDLKKRPSAVFAISDMMAIGFIRKLHAAGLSVPGDVSVAGFDGIEFANYCQPQLTTVYQPSEQMGHEAARLLMRLIRDEDIPEAERWKCLEATLRCGGSTAPPAK